MDGKRNDEPPESAEKYSDEELLKEFETVKRMTVPLPIPDPKPDEFETIWKRIQEGKEKEK
uniref:hypothetical protein n=1 Tax=Enterocloster clostridioformis TaxID=1531 RepID=UPI0026767C71|nr:hypothetical protein [Enterocloster clostridioformis]